MGGRELPLPPHTTGIPPAPWREVGGSIELLVRVAFSGLSISGLLQACSPLVRSAVEMLLFSPRCLWLHRPCPISTKLFLGCSHAPCALGLEWASGLPHFSRSHFFLYLEKSCAFFLGKCGLLQEALCDCPGWTSCLSSVASELLSSLRPHRRGLQGRNCAVS